MNFAEPLARALRARDYVNPTPIQSATLPPQLDGRDLLALAETGSGKTAAFLLPILQAFANKPVDVPPKAVSALILAPTRELAVQIDGEVAALTRYMDIRRAVILGGVSKGPQISALRRGVHICVATPGRLLDHVNERNADLRSVMTLVIDEADRMFDMGFIRDIRKIVSLLPRQRRTALFSATMPKEIRSLAHELLTEPAQFDLSPKKVVVDRINQTVMMVKLADKQSRLHTILGQEACQRVIVFTRTKRGADKVTARLAMAGIGAAAMHGNKAQNARQRALKDFSAGHIRVLVATDIAARGIDVADITHVINFDMPIDAETYVHRIGRTARKGAHGAAISLCDASEIGDLRAIERLTKSHIEVVDDIGGAPVAMPDRRQNSEYGHERRQGGGRRDGHRGRDQHRGGERYNRGGSGMGRAERTPREHDKAVPEQRNENAGFKRRERANSDFKGKDRNFENRQPNDRPNRERTVSWHGETARNEPSQEHSAPRGEHRPSRRDHARGPQDRDRRASDSREHSNREYGQRDHKRREHSHPKRDHHDRGHPEQGQKRHQGSGHQGFSQSSGYRQGTKTNAAASDAVSHSTPRGEYHPRRHDRAIGEAVKHEGAPNQRASDRSPSPAHTHQARKQHGSKQHGSGRHAEGRHSEHRHNEHRQGANRNHQNAHGQKPPKFGRQRAGDRASANAGPKSST